MHEVPEESGNQEPQVDDNEEQKTGNSRGMSELRNQSIQDRKGLENDPTTGTVLTRQEASSVSAVPAIRFTARFTTSYTHSISPSH